MSNKTLIYSPDGAGGNGYNAGTFDPNLLLGMMFGGGGFGGFGGGNMLWPLFLLALWGIWGGGFGNFGGWGGNNGGGFGGCRGGFGFLSDQLNNTAGRELLMQAISGNGNAIQQLATQFGCKAGDIQNALQAISTQICQFSGQTGMGQQQIINALQAGDASLASQIAACCCDVKQLISESNYLTERGFCNTNQILAKGFSDIGYAFRDQTCNLERAGSTNTAAIIAKLDAIEDSRKDRELAEKDRMIATLTARAERQSELQPIYAALNDIQCKQPPTFPMPYVPASGNYIPVNYSVPVHMGVSNYGGCGGYNYGGC